MFFARVWGIVKTKSPFAAVEKAISALVVTDTVEDVVCARLRNAKALKPYKAELRSIVDVLEEQLSSYQYRSKDE